MSQRLIEAQRAYIALLEGIVDPFLGIDLSSAQACRAAIAEAEKVTILQRAAVCPNCRKTTRWTDNGGSLLRCPTCNHSWPTPPADPLAYLSRSELGRKVMQNVQRLIKDRGIYLEKYWYETPHWSKVQDVLNGNTLAAGSTSSGEECRFIGFKPDDNGLLPEGE